VAGANVGWRKDSRRATRLEKKALVVIAAVRTAVRAIAVASSRPRSRTMGVGEAPLSGVGMGPSRCTRTTQPLDLLPHAANR